MKRREQSNRRGAAVVEAAVVLPVFLLILFGMIEFGRALMVNQVLTTAARDACRLAIIGGSSNSEVKQAVKDTVNLTLGLAAADVAVTVSVTAKNGGSVADVASAQQGDLCAIQVQVPYDKCSWFSPAWLDGESLKGDCMMRHL